MKTLCQPDENGVCGQCNRPVPANRYVNCPAKSRNGQPPKEIGKPWSQPGHKLGDWVESKLEAVGITQERYVEFKERHGFLPTCNCQERIKWLNDFGDAFGEAAMAALQAFRR